MAHFAFRRVGLLLVVAQDTQSPADSEWEGYMEACRVLDRETNGTLQGVGALIFTDGGSPTGKQRNAIAALLKGRTATSAVVTDSLVVRSVLSVLGMINPGLKVFPSRDWKKAAAFAGVPEARHLEILKVAVAVGREVGDPQVLRAIGL